MTENLPPIDDIEDDIWAWMREFVAVKNEFYNARFPPCPFAQRALMTRTVDVAAWQSGDVREFIRHHAMRMQAEPRLTTRVMAFPPRTQAAWGLTDFVESLNTKLIQCNLFLNTGIAKTTISRYPGSLARPYFIVVANSLDAVLKGAEALKQTGYYDDWPKEQITIVVERRERLARRYAATGGVGHG